jgi:hypothetical protein
VILHNEVAWDWTTVSVVMSKITIQHFEWMVQFLGAFRKIAKSDFEFRHVGPPVHMEQLGSHWTDFHKISYVKIFQ